MRITNGMITERYKRNLHSSLSDLDYYSNRATTLRKFDKVSEDPVAASKAFRLRRAYNSNEDFYSNTTNAENQLLTAETSMRTISDLVREINSGDKLKAITGTSGHDERAIIASKIRKCMESIVGSANSQYGDKYVFGGANTSDAPFVVADDGTLTYRGVDVNTGRLVFEDGSVTGLNDFKISFGENNGTEFNGFTVNVINDPANPIPMGTSQIDVGAREITVNLANTATGADLQTALQGSSVVNGTITGDLSRITVSGDLSDTVGTGTSVPVTDTVDLQMLRQEKVFVDLGMGLDVSNGVDVNQQSAFNIAVTGLSFMNCGYNADGNPKNLHSLLGEIATELEKEEFDYDKIIELSEVLNESQATLLAGITEIGVRTNYLATTKSKLDDTHLNLSTQINEVEYLDADEAIMDMRLQEYIYNAALKMGSRVIQPSFLDYMR